MAAGNRPARYAVPTLRLRSGSAPPGGSAGAPYRNPAVRRMPACRCQRIRRSMPTVSPDRSGPFPCKTGTVRLAAPAFGPSRRDAPVAHGEPDALSGRLAAPEPARKWPPIRAVLRHAIRERRACRNRGLPVPDSGRRGAGGRQGAGQPDPYGHIPILREDPAVDLFPNRL